MLATLLVLTAPGAEATGFVTEVGEEIRVEVSGGWARIFPDRSSDGWHFLFAAGGNFNLLPMTADYEIADQNREPLTPSTELKDHAIVRCPSGGYLHTGSANLSAPNDTAYAFRYDKNFQLLDWSVLEQEVTERSHNDMPLACAPGEGVTVFGGLAADTHVHNRFFLLDENAQTSETVDNLDIPHTAGCTLRYDPETRDLWVLEMSSLPLDNPGELLIHRLDRNFLETDFRTAQLLPTGYTGHWPSGILRIGDYYMVAFIGWPMDGQWDGHNGDLWISVLDSEWNVLETHQVSENPPDNPGMRPGIARRGSKVLASYDRQVQPHFFELSLDLDAFGVEEGDTGGYWDTGGEEDTGGDGNVKEGGACGCASTPSRREACPLLGLVAALMFRRRTTQSE